ncbi:MAG TPA: GAF domain-containing sensor histidine kinase [Desulfobacteraceae bacterium]|nr:GAF domain-containing sensor histidine kinase [Desulfobacteraceae bacterium]
MRKKLDNDIYRRELSTLIKSSALINSSLQTTDVLNFAMKAAEEFMDAEASSVYELDIEKKDITVSLARGEKGGFIQSRRLKLGEGIAGWVIQSGKPMMVKDVSKEPIFSDRFDRETGFTTQSLICVPLTIRGKTTGAIQVINKKNGRPFTQEDSELLTALAQQIAVALDNAKLYHRLEKNFKLTAEELKVTQQKLIRSERSAAIANLVQGIAHEVRNPIMSIGGFAARMKAELEMNNKFQKYLDIILSETTRLEKLVQDVKEIAEMQTAYLQPENMNSLLSNVIEDFSPIIARESIHVETDIEEGLPTITLDKAQISRALKNIVQNSIEALPTGGTLRVTARAVESNIRIAVEDSGIGIDEDELDSILDPFVTSKTTGAGLGLTMVYQILMNHQGEINIKSRGGKGTVVTIDLPLNPVR